MKDVLFRSSSPRKAFTETIMLIINNTAETSDYFLLKSCSAGHPFSKYLKILAQKTFNAFTKNLVSDLNSSIFVFKKEQKFAQEKPN